MSHSIEYLELRCPRCSWAEVCGPEGVVRWLRRAHKLRARSQLDLPVLYEVFRAAVPQFVCPNCQGRGLALAAAEDDRADWPETRRCEACGKPISWERLHAVPDSTLCAACQREEELGRGPAEIEYCPKCGAPIKLRPNRAGGVTRYVPTCTGNPPCRLRG
jgi:DNA-directed RNA polymerase subunit RPC12/RpoP